MTGIIMNSANLTWNFALKKCLFLFFCHENLVCLAASGFRETPYVRVGNQVLVAIYFIGCGAFG